MEIVSGTSGWKLLELVGAHGNWQWMLSDSGSSTGLGPQTQTRIQNSRAQHFNDILLMLGLTGIHRSFMSHEYKTDTRQSFPANQQRKRTQARNKLRLLFGVACYYHII